MDAITAQRAAFRRPVPPAPIEAYELAHPRVPEALDGFTIVHLSDMHTRRGRPLPRTIQDLRAALAHTPVDLVALTGDYIETGGDEPAAIRMLDALARAWRTRHGAFGIFGNHDNARFRAACARIPGITWLDGRVAEVAGLPLRVVGCSFPEDLPGIVLDHPELAEPGVFPLTLAHYPTEIYPAAAFGLPLVLAGHTHAGQVRFSGRLVAHTSSDLPGELATGVLRLGGTLAAVTRGLGNTALNVRFNCPAQAPLYVLRRRELPLLTEPHTRALTRLIAW